MASTLRMCLVLHIEDEIFTKEVSQSIATLSNIMGARGARLSVQMGAEFSTQDGPDGMYDPSMSSLGEVLINTGNFWLHMHNSSAVYLTSAHNCVMSLYQYENTAAGNPSPDVASVHVSGRSGGTGNADWVHITLNEGLRRQNCGTFQNHQFMPQSLRPYGFTDEEISKLYFHDVAPGPIDQDIGSMRMRPFWMDHTTMWYAKTDSTFPHAAFLGSVMFIPKPSRFSRIAGASLGRTAYPYSTLTVADLDLCLTEIWSVWNLKQTSQNSITNVWYKLLATEDLTPENLSTLGAWIDSINQIMTVNATAPNSPWAAWNNMNEIANLFSHTTSFYY